MLESRAPYATGEGGPDVHGDDGNSRVKKQSDESATATAEEATFAYEEPRVEIVYGNFDIISPRAFHPARAVCRALLGAHADRELIGAWNPML